MRMAGVFDIHFGVRSKTARAGLNLRRLRGKNALGNGTGVGNNQFESEMLGEVSSR
jgi:hypothetical protein